MGSCTYVAWPISGRFLCSWIPCNFEPRTSTDYEPWTSNDFESWTSTNFELCTSTGFEPCTSKGFEPRISTNFEPCNSTGFKPESERQIHPTLIHVVRKGRGNRRYNEKEPVPGIQHWQQEFIIRDKVVSIRNKTSDKDQGRVRIPEEDEMVSIMDDMVLRIGREASELNMIILIPKTEARAAGDDVSLKKLLESRISNPEVLKSLTEKYSKKKS